MGSIKDRNGMDITETEDIKKSGQEYTEKFFKIILMTQKTLWCDHSLSIRHLGA